MAKKPAKKTMKNGDAAADKALIKKMMAKKGKKK